MVTIASWGEIMPLKIIFAGTPDFSVPTLAALIDSPHQVVAVYTQPDRPAGRGRKLQISPVKQLAYEHKLEIVQPKTLKDPRSAQQLADYQADIMVVVAYGLLLPQNVLDTPKYNCINVHASLLPRFRGASPIAQAILSGDAQTGVTIMQMVKALDAGDMLAMASTDINADDTNQSLSERLSKMGSDLLLETLSAIESGKVKPKPQDENLTTYAGKINKSDAAIDWSDAALNINRKVRAYYGWPVAFTNFEDKKLRIWQARALEGKSDMAPGTVMLEGNNKLAVVCGEGLLQLEKVQLPGAKTVAIADFINAHRQKILQQGIILT